MRYPFTEAQKARIAAAYRNETTETAKAMAQEFGCSPSAVIAQAKRLGVWPRVQEKSADNRQCATCGSLIFQYETEALSAFLLRMTCRNHDCPTSYRMNGRRFPEYREVPVVPRPLFVKEKFADPRLMLMRLPRFLWAVEKSVENPATY